MSGLLKADQAYEEALDLVPEEVRRNELRKDFEFGNCQDTWRRVEEMLLEAARIDPDNPDWHFLLGNALADQDRQEAALQAYARAHELDPENATILYNMGHANAHLKNWRASVEAFRGAIRLRPDWPKLHVEMAAALEQCRMSPRSDANATDSLSEGELASLRCDLSTGIHYYQQCVEIQPENAHAWTSLGYAQWKRGDHGAGETSIRQAIELLAAQPGNRDKLRDCYRLLVISHHGTGSLDRALACLSEWKKALPDDVEADHCEGILFGDKPDAASPEYVAAHFDRFSDTFEDVLQGLRYRAPQLIGETLEQCVEPGAVVDVLDAGCGTGLCAPHVAKHAGRLVGVDLSPGMIDKARTLDTYDQLAVADLTSFMRQHPTAFDVVISADTLVYIGDLTPVFQAAAETLRPGGWLLFTTEDHTDDDQTFVLSPTGRYTHASHYVEDALRAAAFTLVRNEAVTVRFEGPSPVPSRLFVAHRST